MNGNIVAAAFSLALIAGVGLYLAARETDAEPAERTARTAANTELEQQVETLRKENADLRKRIAELEQVPPAHRREPEREKKDEEPADGELTDKDIEAGFSKYAKSLQKIIAGKGKDAIAELRALIKKAGPRAIAKVRKHWEDPSEDYIKRLIAAHILAQSGDPDSLELIKSTLRDPDGGMIDHRLASHALAFADVEGLEPLLTEVARNGKEPGVRANASFGLAMRGVDEGIGLYMSATDDAFDEGQPEAIAYLGGLTLLGEKVNPYVRERLLSYTNETAVVSLIEIAKANKDTGALEALNKLAYDASRPISVQKAAKGAIKALTKKAPDK